MALLDVDEVEADRNREFRGGDVMIDESLQFVVGDERRVGRDAVPPAPSSGSCVAMIGRR